MLCTLVTRHPSFDGSPLSPDDLLLQRALTQRGIETKIVSWEAPHHAWERSDLTLLRSACNDEEHCETFCAWVRATASLTALLNPLDVVLWNTHKQHYFTALAELGVPMLSTMWLPRGTYDLGPLLRATGWHQAVLKPCLGGNVSRARLLTSKSIAAEQESMGQWVVEQDMLLQPYLDTIADEGEHGHVFLEGKWSHAYLRRPFQVRKTHALEEPQIFPHQREIDLAIRGMCVVQRLFPRTSPLLYGRVDIVHDGNRYRVMDVAFIEPILHLEYGSALAQFTDAVARRIHQQREANDLLLPA